MIVLYGEYDFRSEKSRTMLQPARPITPLDKDKKSPHHVPTPQNNVKVEHPPPGSMPVLGSDIPMVSYKTQVKGQA